MRLKLTIFINFLLSGLFCGMSVYDLSDSIGNSSDWVYDSIDGNYKLICWKEKDPAISSNYNLYVSVWTGSSFVESKLTDSGSANKIYLYTPFINSAGQCFVAWNEGDYGSLSINCSVYNTTGGEWAKTLIASDIYYFDNIIVCGNSSGKFAIVWRERNSSSNYSIKGAYWNGTNWTVQVFDSGYSEMLIPSAYLDSNGILTVRWEFRSEADSCYNLKVATWDGLN